jgi:hypothetical protein
MRAAGATPIVALAALAAFAMGGLAGCGYTELYEVQLRAATDAPRARVDVYMSEQTPPARPVHDIALVQAMGYGTDAGMEPLVHALVERGRALGCDALYRVHVEQGYTMAHGYGVCVKYAGPDTASTPAPPRPTAAPRTIPPRAAPGPGTPPTSPDEAESVDDGASL